MIPNICCSGKDETMEAVKRLVVSRNLERARTGRAQGIFRARNLSI
jgi:hypothetical protein